ncbi:hypothetical protein WA026_003258 [Henosepilachna vigintioctopunctata]|uniref:Armadillo repeat-containing protein 7 n=1 Tax=Henosepilachna vigintioctopunctata TaxID=420089 RepID=A0AAW1TLQ4_9CUCU
MFSRKEQLIKRTGPDGIGRYEYLKQLINEFTTTRSYEAKRQTLGNLCNFAYDPINYEYFKQLHIVDLFLAQLSENSEELLHFALAGICNLSLDPEFRDYIISLNGIHLVSVLLNQKNEEIILNALTTLYFLITTSNKSSIVTDTLLNRIRRFEHREDRRLQNLSKLLLEKLEV